jgi:uncharacterized protein (TIGR02145 family)
MIRKLIVISILQISVLLAQSQKPVVDIEGNVYRTIKIGNQVWMAENLRVTQYRDGTLIPYVTDNAVWSNLKSGAYCYYVNNWSKRDTYGALYNWYAVNGDTDGDGKKDKEIAPEGWHVPTNKEWTELETYLSNNGHSGTEGATLKSTSGWKDYKGSSGNGTDDYGFTALPCGNRNIDSKYRGVPNVCKFWSATEYVSFMARGRNLHSGTSEVNREGGRRIEGFSIRLLKD